MFLMLLFIYFSRATIYSFFLCHYLFMCLMLLFIYISYASIYLHFSCQYLFTFLMPVFTGNCIFVNCELCNRKESQITCQLTEIFKSRPRSTQLHCIVELALVKFTSKFVFIAVCNFHSLSYYV